MENGNVIFDRLHTLFFALLFLPNFPNDIEWSCSYCLIVSEENLLYICDVSRCLIVEWADENNYFIYRLIHQCSLFSKIV